MQDAVGYIRVSTREQGRSGLGLAAQKGEIEGFCRNNKLRLGTVHQDVQTGAGSDALRLRPGLALALKEAKKRSCPLIVSRLDRLSRNVHFISGLMEHKVHFIVAAFGRDVDNFVLHIYASLAEQERKMISERVKAAIARSKRPRTTLANCSKATRQRIAALGRAAKSAAANERAEACRVYIEWALQQPGINGRRISFHAAAGKLNKRGIESITGGAWTGEQLQRMAIRLRLHHPLAFVRPEVARARVIAVCATEKALTGEQIAALAGVNHPLGINRTRVIVRRLRKAAAGHSKVHRRMGWRLDKNTHARIRVGEIWARHPEYCAAEVHTRLKPSYGVGIRFVSRILRDCWRAKKRPGSKAWRLGRRCYGWHSTAHLKRRASRIDSAK